MGELAGWLEANNISALLVLATALLLMATPLVSFTFNQLLRRLLRDHARRLHLPYDSVLILTRLSTAAVWLISATLILNLWGISLSGLWAVLISAAAVIGVGFLAVCVAAVSARPDGGDPARESARPGHRLQHVHGAARRDR